LETKKQNAMNNYTLTTSLAACTAHVTVNRGRIKHSLDRKVYLKNGQTFEIELFNPHSSPVLAKISLNGKSISDAGIILKPGQRVYLERFIDENKKFLFETYNVENSDEAARAIAQNGKLEVFFYHEYQNWSLGITTGTTTWTQYPTFTTHNPTYISTPNPYTINCSNTFSAGDGSLSTNTAFYSSANTNIGGSLNSHVAKSIAVSDAEKETGRVEKGESSSQSMNTGSGNFNAFASESTTILILPESQKPVEVKEIRNYCTGCGTRMKKTSWKFCPTCGTKID
jgi:hypothetical protein